MISRKGKFYFVNFLFFHGTRMIFLIKPFVNLPQFLAGLQKDDCLHFRMKKKIKRKLRVTRYIFYKETLIDSKEHLITFIGAFSGIGLIGLFNSYFLTSNDNLFLIGSFGASSVLLYGLPNSPLAQPRSLIGGNIISSIIGVSFFYLFPDILWLAAALSVSFSIVLMQITKTLHPPAGAASLIAVIGSDKIKELGYFYVISPVMSGVLVLLLIAMLLNFFSATRNYPSNRGWYKIWKRKYRKTMEG